MLEPDIVKKCAAALIVAGGVVCVAVLASRWGSSVPAPAGRPVSEPGARSGARADRVAPASRAGPAAAPKTASVAAGTPERDPLERKAFRLEMENAKLRGRLDDMVNWILENVKGTYPLPEGQMANLRVAPVDTNLAVSDDLAELLRLNAEELDRLDSALLGTRSVLQELEVEKISVDQPGENQVVLSIPPYAEEGQLVREELYGELKRTLGAARFGRFLQVAEAGLEEQFEYFGEVDRTLEFEALQDTASGESQLFVRDERVVPDKTDPLRQNITASERIVTELPDEYYFYWNWLPEYVTRFARSN